jgi:2-polyprenyl-3-methyl-5-hydroxy-6-metoxy-1,4-benzoquinol methylase
LHYPKEFKVIDRAVSQEVFTLRFNNTLEMYETVPQPSSEALPRYYESEDYISHTNTKRNLFESLYHMVRTLMLRKKMRLISRYSSHKGQLLDIGCGTGDFLLKAQQEGWKVSGIEPNPQARTLAKDKGLEVHDASYMSGLKPQSYELITLWHVLEHLPNLKEQIQHLTTLLKPGGLLVVAVPNFKSYDAQYYKSDWAAYDVPRHFWHFSKNAIAKLFGTYDFVVFDTRPLWFDAFYVSMLSEKLKGSKLGFVKGMLIGTLSNLTGLWSRQFSSHIYFLKAKNAK